MTLAQKLFSFDGRLRRRDWWPLSIGLGVANLLIGDVLRHALLGPNYSVVTGGWSAWLAMAQPRVGLMNVDVSLLLIWPWAAVYIKRRHDRNRGAASAIAVLVWSYVHPLIILLFPMQDVPDPGLALAQLGFLLLNFAVTIWILAVFGILDGTPGPNRFGPSPKT